MTRATKWGMHVPRVLATAVLLAWCGSTLVAADDGALPLRLSGKPLPFLETEDRPVRTGPVIELDDRARWDPGFAVGKSPVEFQSGYTVRDEMMAVGLSKTHIQTFGSSGVRVTGLWAFDPTSRFSVAPEESDVNLVGLFLDGAFSWGLLEVDVARTFAGSERGEQVNSGMGWTGNSVGNNYSMRVNASRQIDQAGAEDVDGALMLLGFSREMGLRRDILYAHGYWAEGDFKSLASSESRPLGFVGLSFSGIGPGRNRPAPWPRPLDSAGFAVGLQTIFAEEAANLTVELGHRQELDTEYALLGDSSGTAFTTRFQYRFANRFLFQMDAYHAMLADNSGGPKDAGTDDDSSALRVELRVNF